jgi:hypothetical protein
MHDWTRYCDRLPTALELDIWLGYPDAGVCAPLGQASNLIALDLDYGSPEVNAAIEAVMPPSPVKKTGAKGYTAFYRFNPKLTSRQWRVEGKPVLELLATGRQTVLPPTVHPDGMRYRWLTPDTLEDFPVVDLPALPDDFIERVNSALQQFQTEADRSVREATREKREPQEFTGYFREINDRALANPDAWVRELLPEAKRARDGSYRAVAHWRNCENANVSIHPKGIVDFGDTKPYTPLDLVMAARGCDFAAASGWLKPRSGMPEPVTEPFYSATNLISEEEAEAQFKSVLSDWASDD